MKPKVFFAWIDTDDEPFVASSHAIYDLVVLNFEISKSEGDDAELVIETENPGLGILRTGILQYALLSWSPTGLPEDAELLFRGRVNGVPDELEQRTYKLHFTAEPDDADTKLQVFGDTLAVAPYVDPLFNDGTAPEDRLVARGQLIEIDERTHEIALSDVLVGDEIIDLGTAYDRESFKLSREDSPPLNRATMTLMAEWTQTSSGIVDLATAVNEPGDIGTLTRGEFENGITPETGSLLGGSSGWTIDQADVRETSRSLTTGAYLTGSKGHWQLTDSSSAIIAEGDVPERKHLQISRWHVDALRAAYSYQQSRKETVSITLDADIQSVFGVASRSETLDEITLGSVTDDTTTDLWAPETDYTWDDYRIYNGKRYRCVLPHKSDKFFSLIPTDGRQVIYHTGGFTSGSIDILVQWEQVPLDAALKASAYSYFETDRGIESIRHAVLRLIAFLRMRMRYVTIDLTGRWSDLCDINCRKSLRIEHPDLPGGEATGKVVSYSKKWDGADQIPTVDVRIGVSVGRDGTAPVPENAGYTDAWDGYTENPDGSREVGVGNVVFEIVPTSPIRKPIDVAALNSPSYAIVGHQWRNTAGAQIARAGAADVGGYDVINAVNNLPTGFSIRMRSLVGEDTLTRSYEVTSTPVLGPRGIDLEAS